MIANYTGRPFHEPQRIPGRLFCADYDLGGEGIAFHDTTPINQGSGRLNPVDGNPLNEFRIDEAVDITYTKGTRLFEGQPTEFDNNRFNLVQPPMDLHYVGWTEPGEWINYTIEVAETGTYAADLLYTSRHGGAISLSIDGVDATGPLPIVSTENLADPIAFRQWHHWNVARRLARLKIEAGRHVLTLHTRETGQMNYAYFDFSKAD